MTSAPTPEMTRRLQALAAAWELLARPGLLPTVSELTELASYLLDQSEEPSAAV